MSDAEDVLPANQPLAPDSVAALTTVLSKALRALGKAGRPEEASRLGGTAWWVLKDACPREAERINGMMHFLAKLPDMRTASDDDQPQERTTS